NLPPDGRHPSAGIGSGLVDLKRRTFHLCFEHGAQLALKLLEIKSLQSSAFGSIKVRLVSRYFALSLLTPERAAFTPWIRRRTPWCCCFRTHIKKMLRGRRLRSIDRPWSGLSRPYRKSGTSWAARSVCSCHPESLSQCREIL